MASETLSFGPRRGDCASVALSAAAALIPADRDAFEWLDALYRATCAILYNYVPTSGHPGGSISSGRIVAGLLFDGLDHGFFSDASLPESKLAYEMITKFFAENLGTAKTARR